MKIKLLFALVLVTVVGVAFLIGLDDPETIYYGHTLRKSELNSFVQKKSSSGNNTGLYCFQLQLSLFPLFDASLICFDTQNELQQFAGKHNSVQNMLSGKP